MLITLAGILTRALLLQTPVSSLRHHTRPVFDLPGVRMASKRSIISDPFAPKKAAKSEVTTTATAPSTPPPRKPVTAPVDPGAAAKAAAKREGAGQKLGRRCIETLIFRPKDFHATASNFPKTFLLFPLARIFLGQSQARFLG